MRRVTKKIFTLAELKAEHPDAYERVLKAERDSQEDIPWQDETFDSMKACIEACGATLKDWSIGAYSPSHVRVEVQDDYRRRETGETTPKGVPWLIESVLKPNGYLDHLGAPSFPGVCKWTGYCVDDDMIEAVYEAMRDGSNLSDALEGLADKARETLEAEDEYQRSEEAIAERLCDREYDANGDEYREAPEKG